MGGHGWDPDPEGVPAHRKEPEPQDGADKTREPPGNHKAKFLRAWLWGGGRLIWGCQGDLETWEIRRAG